MAQFYNAIIEKHHYRDGIGIGLMVKHNDNVTDKENGLQVAWPYPIETHLTECIHLKLPHLQLNPPSLLGNTTEAYNQTPSLNMYT